MSIELLNIDCLEYMKGCDDNSFDLAIVDPPYGHSNHTIQKGNTRSNIAEATKIKPYDNSESPSREYFEVLQRISKNQIIFGVNHFAHKFDFSGPGWFAWYKHTTGAFSDCELAYTSFDCAAKVFDYVWNGMHQGSFVGDVRKNEKRIHPTQKPVALYDWILSNYAEKGQRVFDSHLGSGSSAIASHYFGVDFVGCELDKDYYKSTCERFDLQTRQEALF